MSSDVGNMKITLPFCQCDYGFIEADSHDLKDYKGLVFLLTKSQAEKILEALRRGLDQANQNYLSYVHSYHHEGNEYAEIDEEKCREAISILTGDR